MASARLSAYLRTVKVLSEEHYNKVKDVISDKLQEQRRQRVVDGDSTSCSRSSPSATADADGMIAGRSEDVGGDGGKNLCRLIMLSCAVCGIELCYAAETAFVSPTLLRLGVPIRYATLAWCFSPLIGLVLGPVLGSLSDRCPSKLGRRRPFILFLSVGILIGLVLVPHGQQFGRMLGDDDIEIGRKSPLAGNMTSQLPRKAPTTSASGPHADDVTQTNWRPPHIGIALTVIGVVLLDCCCDACQSPCRTYLLDVNKPEHHAAGLTTFTVMAGLGGSVGYLFGGVVDWKHTQLGSSLGGHIQVVFGVVMVVYIVFVAITVCSVREVSLDQLQLLQQQSTSVGKYHKFDDEDSDDDSQDVVKNSEVITYGSSDQSSSAAVKTGVTLVCRQMSLPAPPPAPTDELNEEVSFKFYLQSLIRMPASLLVLCVTNFFCWSSLVCYSLYFTDFVGQSVYGGDPLAPTNSSQHLLYETGVRTGSLGMAVYSASCSVYSLNVEKLVAKFGARNVYVASQLFYSVGALLIALTRHRVSVVLLSVCPGVMYATLFTMPYILLARYHSTQQFDTSQQQQVRGLGTDVALVGSMVFVAQINVSAFIGYIIQAAGSPVVVMITAAVFSLCGAISATRVHYVGL